MAALRVIHAALAIWRPPLNQRAIALALSAFRSLFLVPFGEAGGDVDECRWRVLLQQPLFQSHESIERGA
jgi:hypothetical protein